MGCPRVIEAQSTKSTVLRVAKWSVRIQEQQVGTDRGIDMPHDASGKASTRPDLVSTAGMAP